MIKKQHQFRHINFIIKRIQLFSYFISFNPFLLLHIIIQFRIYIFSCINIHIRIIYFSWYIAMQSRYSYSFGFSSYAFCFFFLSYQLLPIKSLQMSQQLSQPSLCNISTSSLLQQLFQLNFQSYFKPRFLNLSLSGSSSQIFLYFKRIVVLINHFYNYPLNFPFCSYTYASLLTIYQLCFMPTSISSQYTILGFSQLGNIPYCSAYSSDNFYIYQYFFQDIYKLYIYIF
ncbi:unnamed protein product (macronuclear) [Paramecium tetraurelia]|uniref:Transmembrane protein n=1 Tax=Paramecium tetraurelia TaxID=5888 RepID=A0C254_PARTE|nr:uncharacterized protein GSPATT00034348001 [Paramecium tetraurelia]CAK64871.1 unnamed protein product [Paramecium tetraurelia]|eukprot:XP_001432268.1 hypothetical protein (macronuclear) [Paramecium tetraurelia strain d4-2]